MRRREFIAMISRAAIGWSVAATAQRSSGRALIGVLVPAPQPVVAPFLDALRQGLYELGHVEGQDIVIEVRFGTGAVEALPALAAELAALNPACIVTGSDPAVLASRRATRSIPIVIAGISGDPVALGLAASFSRPGANITGTTLSIVSGSGDVGLTGKQIEVLRELQPSLSRIGVAFDAGDPIGMIYWKSAQEAARILKIDCTALEVRRLSEWEIAFSVAKRQGIGALIVVGTPLSYSNRDRVIALAAQTGLPAIYGQREFVVAGGLMSYGASLPGVWRHAASFVDKILKGAEPGDLPIEQPTVFELVVNLKTAKALGLMIPSTLIARADEVIE
jgi:putative ABC transport system substrate-binding protein